MEKDLKDLLLKDLCSRLPYDVKMNHIADDECSPKTLIGIDKDIITLQGLSGYEYVPVEHYKPYLFPLSSMTEEQLKEMQEIIGNPNEACISVNTSGFELWLNSIDTDPTIWLDTIFEVQDWLNKNHFDYRGLIEKGLAIDSTGKNIY